MFWELKLESFVQHSADPGHSCANHRAKGIRLYIHKFGQQLPGTQVCYVGSRLGDTVTEALKE